MAALALATTSGGALMVSAMMALTSSTLIGSMAICSFATSARNALSLSVAAKAWRGSASRSGGVPGGAR
jgi:hypothetical protein